MIDFLDMPTGILYTFTGAAQGQGDSAIESGDRVTLLKTGIWGNTHHQVITAQGGHTEVAVGTLENPGLDY